MRAVLDTVLFVRGLINPLNHCGRIVFDHADACEFIVSPQVTTEYLEVLWRPELVRKFHVAGTRNLYAVLNIIARATVVELTDIEAICRNQRTTHSWPRRRPALLNSSSPRMRTCSPSRPMRTSRS